MKKVLSIAIVMVAISSGAFAQSSSATALASANIIAPLVITNWDDMSFGNIIASGTAGAVELAPTGFRTALGGVSLPPNGFVSPARFRVNGEGNSTYAITLPTTEHIISEVVFGIESMIVDDFTSIPSGNGTLDAGEEWIQVGATLHVNANQPRGTYVSSEGGFQVTVNYN